MPGEKFDRMAHHIYMSERAQGRSEEDAKRIGYATAMKWYKAHHGGKAHQKSEGKSHKEKSHKGGRKPHKEGGKKERGKGHGHGKGRHAIHQTHHKGQHASHSSHGSHHSRASIGFGMDQPHNRYLAAYERMMYPNKVGAGISSNLSDFSASSTYPAAHLQAGISKNVIHVGTNNDLLNYYGRVNDGHIQATHMFIHQYKDYLR